MSIPAEIQCPKCKEKAGYAVSSATRIVYTCPNGHDTIVKKETGEDIKENDGKN